MPQLGLNETAGYLALALSVLGLAYLSVRLRALRLQIERSAEDARRLAWLNRELEENHEKLEGLSDALLAQLDEEQTPVTEGLDIPKMDSPTLSQEAVKPALSRKKERKGRTD